MKMHFWKVLGFVGFVSAWAAEALRPDEDGKVRITIEELKELAEGMCNAFGWKAEDVNSVPFMCQNGKLSGTACPPPLECLVGLLLNVGWSEILQHRVVLGVEGFQLRILGFSGGNQDGVCKTDPM